MLLKQAFSEQKNDSNEIKKKEDQPSHEQSFSHQQKDTSSVDVSYLPNCPIKKIYILKDLLPLIFLYLPIDMLGTICRVNSLWNQIASNCDFWEKVSTRTDLTISSKKTKITKDQLKLMFLKAKEERTVYIVGQEIKVSGKSKSPYLPPPPRKDISKKEIICAFPKNETMQIFKTVGEARRAIHGQPYVFSIASGFYFDYFRPIFKVELKTLKSPDCNFSDIKKIFSGHIKAGAYVDVFYFIEKKEVIDELPEINQNEVKNDSKCVIS